MANSFVSAHVHVIFSTLRREPMVLPAFRGRLWAYMGGITREHKMKALAVGGTMDHCHLLLSLPSTLAIAKAVQLIKSGSTKWLHESVPGTAWFSWQEGYGAFTVSRSMVPEVVRYIESQEEHHRKRTFQDEYREFLDAHEMEYDERYVWG
jgi:REP element-mobilizing transposase RayT